MCVTGTRGWGRTLSNFFFFKHKKACDMLMSDWVSDVCSSDLRASERLCNTRIADEKAAVLDTLKSFAEIGGALLGAQDDGTALDGIIATGPGWERFRTLVATASALTNVLSADPPSRVLAGCHLFRLYAPRLRSLPPIARPTGLGMGRE